MNICVLDKATLGNDLPFDELRALGNLTIYDYTSVDEVVGRIIDMDIIIINKIKITEEVLSKTPNLKLICVFATGYDNVDIIAAKAHSVAVANVPAYSTESVTIFTVTAVLALYTHLREYSDYVRSGKYTESGMPNAISPVYHELNGKTWGIIGYGNIGKRVADIARAFGAQVIVYKKTKDNTVGLVDLDTLCMKSDIITIHCPLNEQTHAMINEDKIKLMKHEAIVVNQARGAVIDESAIANAIKSGRIGGFGTDVYSREPIDKKHPIYEIKDYSNVILTPHSAWAAFESRERCLRVIIENISAFVQGKIQNRVDI